MVWVVAGYLILLVPVNWLLFRLLGRVEWAWVAAPVIAVACSLLVIHLAQLDIGFVRRKPIWSSSRPRRIPRYVTRYSAVYSSLSTTYQMVLRKIRGRGPSRFPPCPVPRSSAFCPARGGPCSTNAARTTRV